MYVLACYEFVVRLRSIDQLYHCLQLNLASDHRRLTTVGFQGFEWGDDYYTNMLEEISLAILLARDSQFERSKAQSALQSRK